MVEGTNVITVATTAPETPGVEAIKVALNDTKVSFSSDEYNQYLENAIEGYEYVSDVECENITTLSATNSTAASPVYYANVDLKYSFWKTFSFTKDQEIFITSSSETAHIIDVQFYGTIIKLINPPVLPVTPGIIDSTNIIKYRTDLTLRPISLYTPATSAEMQGLNWAGLSEKALNSTKQIATVKMTIPKTGMYLIRLRSKKVGELSVADLNVNGEYYYEDAPIYLSYVPCIIPTDGNEYASMTNCYSSSDNPMIFIHGGVSDRLVGYNNDGESTKLAEYGLSSHDAYISQVYFVPTTGISVSNYSSSNPESKCSIYARVANGNEASAAKAMQRMPSSTTAVTPIKNANMPNMSMQGNVLNVYSGSGIKSVAVYTLSGTAVTHTLGNGSQTSISLQNSNAFQKGLYIVSVETESGTVSQKFLVK